MPERPPIPAAPRHDAKKEEKTRARSIAVKMSERAGGPAVKMSERRHPHLRTCTLLEAEPHDLYSPRRLGLPVLLLHGTLHRLGKPGT